MLEDECSRFKINWRLANGPATAGDVVDYLQAGYIGLSISPFPSVSTPESEGSMNELQELRIR